MINTELEYILCAAVYYDDGIKHEHQPKNVGIGLVVCGRRHHNCLYTTYALRGSAKDIATFEKNALRNSQSVQGFLTSKDRFVNRREAYFVAKAAGQLLHNMHDESNLQLVSEDIY